MPQQYPLKKGQEVFVKRPVEIYANVVGARNWGLPDDANVCCVELKPATQYYLWDDLEASQRLKAKPPQQLDFSEREREINGMITRRAYELFESGGYMHGRDRDDWLRAESEILLNVPVDIRETETELMIRADVPGFSEGDTRGAGGASVDWDCRQAHAETRRRRRKDALFRAAGRSDISRVGFAF